MRLSAGILAGWLAAATPAAAQYHVTFRVSLPPGDTSKAIYLAGSFNNWSPGQAEYQLKKEPSGVRTITINLPRGEQSFKLTRGSWETVEVAPGGHSIENRIFSVSKDTSMNLTVANWADRFPAAPKRSTASANVQVIDTAFYMPQLKRHRRIWIYLPPDYRTSSHRYPVLYMHDGQNLFDEATSAYGEWGIDEAMDTLGSAYGQSIIIGIDNGGERRLNEYSPYDMERYGKGEGQLYTDFLVHTLKPFIDAHYRTQSGAAHTSIAGSSMGGLISFYAFLKYPKVFGAAGIFSPSFWISPQLKKPDPRLLRHLKGRLYFYAGQRESESMVTDLLFVQEQVQRYSKTKIHTAVRAEGRHNEASWRAEFPMFYKWISQIKDLGD